MCAFGTGRSRSPQGAALVIVMLVMAVLLLAGTTFLTISSTESQIAMNERAMAQALTLAEGGIHKTIARLNADSSHAGEANTSLGGGAFTVSKLSAASVPVCNSTSTDWEVTSTMPVRDGQARAKLHVTLDQVSYPFRWGVYTTTDYLFIGSLWSSTLATVDSYDSTLEPTYDSTRPHPTGGNIGSNVGAYIWYAQVNGNLKSGGLLSTWNSNVSGLQAAGAPLETFPTTPVIPSGTTSLCDSSGNLSLPSNPLPPGDYSCAVSPLLIPDNTSLTTSGEVTIYVAGNISIGNSVTLAGAIPSASGPATLAPPNLKIITRSDGTYDSRATVSTGSNFKLYGVLYGPNTEVNLGNSAEVYGSIIARRCCRDIWMPSWWEIMGPNIHYDQALTNQRLCHGGKYSLVRGTWREVTL